MQNHSIDPNEFFKQIAIRICGSLDINKALESCLTYLKSIIPVTWIHLSLTDLEQNLIRFVGSASDPDEKNFGDFLSVPDELKGEWIHGKYFNKDTEIINNPADDPIFTSALKKLGIDLDTSFIYMRLELEGNRIGSLIIKANGTHAFTEEHKMLFSSVHEPFAIAMANALKHQELNKLKDLLADDNRYLRREIHEITGTDIIGADFGLQDVMNMVRQVAPLDSPVLLLGETGVGKGLIASAIHHSSPRKNGPFLKVNCGAIPHTLIDSELFGHEKGAFTGAIEKKRGRFERADGGTIFLDEIGELPHEAQIRMLNVLQSHEIERIGGTKSIPVDIRIISATHRDLKSMVDQKLFREDLWFRLNVFPITIPPLRQRKNDIPAMAHYFMEQKTKELKLDIIPKLKPGSMDKLIQNDWPGNVRELQNVVERAIIQHQNGEISFDHLEKRSSEKHLLKHDNFDRGIVTLDEMTRMHIKKALGKTKGKISGKNGAASILDINPNTLRKRMDKLEIQYKKRQ